MHDSGNASIDEGLRIISMPGIAITNDQHAGRR
jgi:hypothetical protein